MAVGVAQVERPGHQRAGHAQSVEPAGRVLERHAARKLVAGMVRARRIRRHELERVGLVGTGQPGALGALLADGQAD